MRRCFETLMLATAFAGVISCGGESVPDLPPGVHDLHAQILSTKLGAASGPVRVVYLTKTALDDAGAVDAEARAVLTALGNTPLFAKVGEAWVYPCDNADCAEHTADREALKYRRSGSGPWQRGGGGD
jgi:hypothetical protein